MTQPSSTPPRVISFTLDRSSACIFRYPLSASVFPINLEVLQRSGAREGFACRCEATTGTGHRAERDADASLGAGRIRRTLEDRLYVKIGSAQRKSAATGLPRRWTRSRPRLQSRIVAVPPSRPEGEHVSLVHRVSLSLPPHHARRPPRGHV